MCPGEFDFTAFANVATHQFDSGLNMPLTMKDIILN